MREDRLAELFLAEVRRDLRPYLRRIHSCLRLLIEKQIWWRPNPASNSAGNLVLHLCGNMRQWIISGLGGAPDVRDRDAEFAARSAHSRRALQDRLAVTFREADAVLRRVSPEALARRYVIQGFRVTGLAAVAHVYSHFSYHAGQIAYLTKLQQGRDLRLTKLPKQRQSTRRTKK
jgi:uncharacterized damage-inducible protein DinB